MNYASWKKCDFQIHTPRDPNWKGERPIGINEFFEQTNSVATKEDVDNERAKWAANFVDHCISKGLQAIALTDHHEMIMLQYVEKELELRKKEDPNFDLWLFLGMELTTRGGKQCLILFDANLSDEWRKLAQAKLGIEYAKQIKLGAVAEKITQISINYPNIAQTLDDIDGLQGKYIVLPNVSQGNSYTVLTRGGHKDFRSMPYVGGYLDNGQTIETLKTKNRKRLSGTDPTWSEREIYPLPTSDSRSANYNSLGENDTWIKLAEPTAEGIRQAFLAHHSRISITPPQIPNIAISAIEIKNSSILGSQTLIFSPEFNSIIGGRGSGKSTFLEYLAFGLGRSSYDAPRERYSGTSRMRGLIEETLISSKGSVVLHLVQDNANFKISRSCEDYYQPSVTFPKGDKQSVSPKDLRNLFPAVVYSQGELAELGGNAGESAQLSDLLRFVHPEFKIKNDQFSSRMKSLKNEVKSLVQAVVEYYQCRSLNRKLKANRDSYKQRVEALENNLPTRSENDKIIISTFEKLNEFDSIRKRISERADRIVRNLDEMVSDLSDEANLQTSDEIANNVIEKFNEFISTVRSSAEQLQHDANERRKVLSNAESKWLHKFDNARNARDKVLEQLGVHKTITDQILQLRSQIDETEDEIRRNENTLGELNEAKKLLRPKLNELWELISNQNESTKQWVADMEQLANNKIKANFVPYGDTLEFKEALDTLAQKTRSQEATRDKELQNLLVASEHPQKLIVTLLEECVYLFVSRELGATGNIEKSKCKNVLTILGDTENIFRNLVENLDLFKVQAIATAVANPVITLSFVDGSRTISFDKASEGQRSAALLFMLLEQAGGPLIIDQPEGDLDNRIIVELTDKLHEAKQKRQLIFASHNANIVVNGSSELVGNIDVGEGGERNFEHTGAIDLPSVREVITSTMEGGEKAFKDRQEKYGY